MNKKILIGSIIAVVILVIASFPSSVAVQNIKTNGKEIKSLQEITEAYFSKIDKLKHIDVNSSSIRVWLAELCMEIAFYISLIIENRYIEVGGPFIGMTFLFGLWRTLQN